MYLSSIFLSAILLVTGAFSLDTPLDIDVTHKVDCERPTQRGDKINVHYRGTLASDGSEFDASYNRGQPLTFTVGKVRVYLERAYNANQL